MRNKAIKVSAQVYILFSALSFLYVSITGFISPQAVMNLVNVQLTNTDAVSSVRGVYGGVGLSIVIILTWLMLKDFQKGLVVLSLLWGFYALSRIITSIKEGALGGFGTQWLFIESLFFIIAFSLLLLTIKKQKPVNHP